MSNRSRISLRRAGLMGLFLGGVLLSPVLQSCGPPDGAVVIPEAEAGCEPATEQLTITNEKMLTGRNCGACHKAGGQATNSPFTVAGTVFAEPNSSCNGGGVAGVFVEIQDQNGNVQDNGTLRTNAVGNFWTSSRFTTPLRVRVYQTDAMGMVTHENCMNLPVGGGVKVNCTDCHKQQPASGAMGRLYLKDGSSPCTKM